MIKKDRLDIIYEDKELIVINKPSRMLTIGTDDDKINNLYHKVYEYLHKKNKNNRVFIVHRLDKDTSGVIVFAKNEKLKKALQDNWNECTKREYYAIVEGFVKDKHGVIKEYLKETKTLLTYSTNDKVNGKYAETEFDVIKASKSHSILSINIKTGRKNQIRVAMQDIKHPIIGDKKYGSTKNPLRRVCLHANKLVLTNPLNNKVYEFNAPIPQEFKIFN